MLQSLVPALVESDWEVRVMLPNDPDKSQTWSFEAGVHPTRLQPDLDANGLWNLRTRISEYRPDIIHAWGYPSHLRAMTGSLGLSIPQKFASFFEIPPSQSMTRRWIETQSLADVQLTAAHEAIVGQLLPEGYRQDFRIIPHGISGRATDRSQARQRLLELLGRKSEALFLAGTVSDLSPRYRLKDLVWAVDLLGCIRDDVHLLIFPTGNDSHPLRRFISKTASREHVHFVPPELVADDYLAGLDVYWNSQLEEPLPASMMSAMSWQIPVVSVLGFGTSELIQPLQSGLATNLSARDEFARWTKYLIEQPESAQQLALQGKEHVEAMFPTARMIDGYLDLYSMA
jgi:glycosyltransferase involved in cell wall biosynthesis